VSSDRDLQRMRQQRPDARKVTVNTKDTWRAFIDGIAADNESKEETFRNLRIDTDGDIATVWFDYSFHAGGRETNHGREAWQLVNTDDSWKIISVIYSVDRMPEAEPSAAQTEVAVPVDGGGR
jgi:GH15 family glucan-1,4-alpha-glucosidase